MNLYYLAPNANHHDARTGSILAATDIYGASSAEVAAVKAAWDAVGVFDSEEEISEYFILAKRSSGNYYFLTPDKVSGKDRLIAVDAGSTVRSGIDTINASTDYLWTVEESAQGVLLKSSNDQYLSCTAAKTATLASTGTELVARDNADGTVTFHYAASSTEERYLSLATSGNNYFVFYANENQFTHMLLMKKGSGTPTAIESANELPSANKVLRDGQVYIIRDGAMYNMMGQKIE